MHLDVRLSLLTTVHISDVPVVGAGYRLMSAAKMAGYRTVATHPFPAA